MDITLSSLGDLPWHLEQMEKAGNTVRYVLPRVISNGIVMEYVILWSGGEKDDRDT